MLFLFLHDKSQRMCKIFNWIFNRKESKATHKDDVMKKYLIVGLGNIGEDYTETRHNIGFKILDHFAATEGFAFAPDKLGSKATYRLKGRSFIFIKPATFMNLSGKAVKYWLEKEKIPLDNLLVITDDLNLPFGSIRMKTKGSDGGHNGLKDIQDKLNTTKYNRFRFGISNSFGKGRQVDYVLGQWNDEELKTMDERLDQSVALVKSFVLAGVNNTMNAFNGK